MIVVAASDGYELAAADLLASVGLRVRGFLVGGMTAWRSEGRQVEPPRADRPGAARRAARRRRDAHGRARRPRGVEFAAGHIRDSIHIPYGELTDRLTELPTDRSIAAICSGGKRSGLAASILQREGFENVIHVGNGGVVTWKRAGRPLVSDEPQPTPVG